MPVGGRPRPRFFLLSDIDAIVTIVIRKWRAKQEVVEEVATAAEYARAEKAEATQQACRSNFELFSRQRGENLED